MQATKRVESSKVRCRRFIADESGASAIEYSLIAAGIAGAVIATVATLGSKVKTNLWDKIAGVF